MKFDLKFNKKEMLKKLKQQKKMIVNELNPYSGESSKITSAKGKRPKSSYSMSHQPDDQKANALKNFNKMNIMELK